MGNSTLVEQTKRTVNTRGNTKQESEKNPDLNTRDEFKSRELTQKIYSQNFLVFFKRLCLNQNYDSETFRQIYFKIF